MGLFGGSKSSSSTMNYDQRAAAEASNSTVIQHASDITLTDNGSIKESFDFAKYIVETSTANNAATISSAQSILEQGMNATKSAEERLIGSFMPYVIGGVAVVALVVFAARTKK